ncbi:hypothetical protein AAVH_27578, partial [Aphelenchoides avenae]
SARALSTSYSLKSVPGTPSGGGSINDSPPMPTPGRSGAGPINHETRKKAEKADKVYGLPEDPWAEGHPMRGLAQKGREAAQKACETHPKEDPKLHKQPREDTHGKPTVDKTADKTATRAAPPPINIE